MLPIIVPITTVILIVKAAILIAPFANVPFTALPVAIHLAPLSAVLIGGFITTLRLLLNIMVMVVDPLLFLSFTHHNNTSINK